MSRLQRIKPVGAKAEAWRKSRAFISGIIGPVGGGKTTTGVAKCFEIAARQLAQPDGRGGRVRRARIAVIRDTYPNLDETVLRTWNQWVPREVGKYTHDAPRRHVVQMGLGATEYLELEMIFLAIGDKRVEDVLRGFELTAAWLNEADRLSRDVLAYLTGRIGRYPSAKDGGCVEPSIIMDLNAPDTDNWIYALLVDNDTEAFDDPELTALIGDRPVVECFIQPGGRDPGAENLANLPKGFYALQVAANRANPGYVARMIDNKFVPVRHGQPVFPEFNLDLHQAGEAPAFDPMRKLVVGLDAGLTPAAVFTQRDSLGRLIVLGELVVFAEPDETLEGVGPTRFGRAVRAYIDQHFPGVLGADPASGRRGSGASVYSHRDGAFSERAIRCVADPAAFDGVDGHGHEKSWVQIVQAALGERVHKGRTNRLHVRLEAVRRPMLAMVDGRHPGFVLAPSCRTLRKGFLSGYHYVRVAVSDGVGRFDSVPAKNMFSHVQDALQYAAMDDGDAVAEILGKGRGPRGRRTRERVDHGAGYFSGGE